MDFLIQFQLNLFTLIILVVLLGIIKVKTQLDSFGKRILEYVVIFSGIGIITEPLTWIFDGQTYFGAYFLEYLTNFILVLIAPVIGGLMLSYVDYYIYKDLRRIRKRLYYSYFFMFSFVILIINLFTPIYFSINQTTNVYSQGDYFWIHYLSIGLMYVYMFSFILKNRKRTFRYAMNIFIIFFSLPILGMIIQIINNRLFFAWNSIALAILVTYVFLESNSTEKDYLTKLYNRQSYEKYVNQLIESKKEFGIMLIDLDKFKEINDDYGHQKGDQVLVEFSNILSKQISCCKFASRLAGDEFIIVVEEEIDIKFLIKEIYHFLQISTDKVLRDLKFSYGYIEFKEGDTLDQLYTTVDREMYKNKLVEKF